MVLVIVKVRKVNDARCLLAGNLHDSRVGMTQSVYSQPSHEVQVAFPFEVVEKHALAPFNGNRIASEVWIRERRSRSLVSSKIVIR